MPLKGDPVALNYAALVDHEVDYASAEPRFAVRRDYYSLGDDYTNIVSPTSIPGFGARWHGLIPGRLAVSNNAGQVEYLAVDGSFSIFGTDNGYDQSVWTWNTHAATRLRLSMVSIPPIGRADFFYGGAAVANGPGEVRLDMAQGEYILFRRAGPNNPADSIRYLVPVEHGWADGYRIFYTYPDTGENPATVSDSLGRQMTLTWISAPRDTYASLSVLHDIKVISQIGLPDGTMLQYTYGKGIDEFGSTIKNRLEGAKHLSAGGAVLWAHSFLYENSAVPYALTGKVDQNGNRLSTYAYDAAGLATSTEEAGGVDKYLLVNLEDTGHGASFLRQVTNPLGYRQDYVFYKAHNNTDAQRVLQSVTGYAAPGIEATTANYEYWGYIGDSSIADYTDELGHRTDYDVDGQLRPTRTREASNTPDIRTTNATWDPVYDLPSHVETPGLATDYTYSPTGLPLTVTLTDTTSQSIPYATAGQTRQWTYGWNGNGRLSSVNGPKGPDANGKDDVTSFTYDGAGNLLTATDALGHVTTFANYDANGRPGKMTDPNGVDTLYAYDLLGRLSTVAVRDPGGVNPDAVTTFGYDVEGRVTGVSAPATDKLFVDYDLAGRATAVRAASGEKIVYSYDALRDVTGETVKRSDATTARAITRTFDQLGRMLTETLGPGRTTTWGYDKGGNVLSVTSARSNATQQAFDGLNRLVSTIAPDSGTTAATYDAHDAETSFTDPAAVTTSFVRDGFGDVIGEVSPDRGTSVYYYDAAGDRTAEIDGRGQRVDIVRDALGRITKKTPAGRPASETVTYAYDTAAITGSYGVGRLASVADASGTTRFKYDYRGNLLIQQQVIGATTVAQLRYGYDLADRIVSMTYPSGRVALYARDSKGRVTAVKTRPAGSPVNTTLVSGMSYEAFGPLLRGA